MIDIWLIFAQIIPFVYVLLFTIRDTIDEEKGKKGKSLAVLDL